jgi:hypothetical protein
MLLMSILIDHTILLVSDVEMRLAFDRFTHGSRNVAIGVKGKERDRRGIPSANNALISLGTKGVIASYGDDCRAHGEEDVRRASVNGICGDKDVRRTTLEVMDGKHDTTGETVVVTDCELSSDGEESCGSVTPYFSMDDVGPIDILTRSSHYDGSIYKGTSRTTGWKRKYRIADRNESK